MADKRDREGRRGKMGRGGRSGRGEGGRRKRVGKGGRREMRKKGMALLGLARVSKVGDSGKHKVLLGYHLIKYLKKNSTIHWGEVCGYMEVASWFFPKIHHQGAGNKIAH